MGALVYYFKSIVENSVGRPESLKRIITWKRICVANASIGLIIYGVRLALEIYQFCKNNELDKEIIPVIIYCFLFVLKVMRILAFNSFSSWMRLKLASQGPQDVFGLGLPKLQSSFRCPRYTGSIASQHALDNQTYERS